MIHTYTHPGRPAQNSLRQARLVDYQLQHITPRLTSRSSVLCFRIGSPFFPIVFSATFNSQLRPKMLSATRIASGARNIAPKLVRTASTWGQVPQGPPVPRIPLSWMLRVFADSMRATGRGFKSPLDLLLHIVKLSLTTALERSRPS